MISPLLIEIWLKGFMCLNGIDLFGIYILNTYFNTRDMRLQFHKQYARFPVTAITGDVLVRHKPSSTLMPNLRKTHQHFWVTPRLQISGNAVYHLFFPYLLKTNFSAIFC